MSRQFGLDRGLPIDRYYIDEFIRANAGLIRGQALEVGELKYLNEYGHRATHKVILAPNQDVVKARDTKNEVLIGDLTQPDSLPITRFDCFVCTQMLNVIYDVKVAIRGAHQLLAPGGAFLGTAVSISQVSRYDMDRWGDYWRFTTKCLRNLLEVFRGPIEVRGFGNVLAAQAFLLGLAVEDVPSASLLAEHDDDYQLVIGLCARK